MIWPINYCSDCSGGGVLGGVWASTQLPSSLEPMGSQETPVVLQKTWGLSVPPSAEQTSCKCGVSGAGGPTYSWGGIPLPEHVSLGGFCPLVPWLPTCDVQAYPSFSKNVLRTLRVSLGAGRDIPQ